MQSQLVASRASFLAVVAAFSASLVGAQSITATPTATGSSPAITGACTDCNIFDNVDGGHTIAVFSNDTESNTSITGTVIPHVTQFANGTRTTSYETQYPDDATTVGDYVVIDGKYIVAGQTLTVDQVYYALHTSRKFDWQTRSIDLDNPLPTCRAESFSFEFNSIIPKDEELRSSIANTLFPSLFTSAASASHVTLPADDSTCSREAVAPVAQNSAAFLTFQTAEAQVTSVSGAPVTEPPTPSPTAEPPVPATSDPIPPAPAPAPGPAPAPQPAPAPAPGPAPAPNSPAPAPAPGAPAPAPAPSEGVITVGGSPATIALPSSDAAPVVTSINGAPVTIVSGEVQQSGTQIPISTVQPSGYTPIQAGGAAHETPSRLFCLTSMVLGAWLLFGN